MLTIKRLFVSILAMLLCAAFYNTTVSAQTLPDHVAKIREGIRGQSTYLRALKCEEISKLSPYLQHLAHQVGTVGAQTAEFFAVANTIRRASPAHHLVTEALEKSLSVDSQEPQVLHASATSICFDRRYEPLAEPGLAIFLANDQ